ncbi:MAG: DUF6323 family protein [Eubacteriales bacterium]
MPKYDLIALLNDKKTQALAEKKYAGEILEYNNVSSVYGLALTEEEAAELAHTRTTALAGNGRIEAGLGAVGLIIEEFCKCDSIAPGEYANVINDLTELFYYVKSESEDRISDTRLVAFMREYFEKSCGGSVELLATREAEALLRYIGNGKLTDGRRRAKEKLDYENMHYEDYNAGELGGEDDYSDTSEPEDD